MRTALHRYLELSDQSHDESAFEEAIGLFADDATVHLMGEPAKGIQAVREFYRQYANRIAESHHLWRVTHADAHTATAVWGIVARTPEGDIITARGTEVVEFDHDGRITSLVNTPS